MGLSIRLRLTFWYTGLFALYLGIISTVAYLFFAVFLALQALGPEEVRREVRVVVGQRRAAARSAASARPTAS